MGNKSSKDHALTCTAYVNGVSSSVPIILSSRVHHIEWDIVLATPSHLKRYKLYDNDPNLNSRRYMDGFSIVMGCTSKEGRKARSEEFDNAMEMEEEEEKNADEDSEEEDDFECDWGDGRGGGAEEEDIADEPREILDTRSHPRILHDQNVLPVTWVQLCQMWWLCRTLCFTSSTSDLMIISAAPFIHPRHPMRKQFQMVLEFVGLSKLLPDTVPDGEDNADADADTEDNANADEEDNDDTDDEEDSTALAALRYLASDDEDAEGGGNANGNAANGEDSDAEDANGNNDSAIEVDDDELNAVVGTDYKSSSEEEEIYQRRASGGASNEEEEEVEGGSEERGSEERGSEERGSSVERGSEEDEEEIYEKGDAILVMQDDETEREATIALVHNHQNADGEEFNRYTVLYVEHGIDEHGIDNGPRSESDVRAERIRRLEDVEDESVEEQNQNELLLADEDGDG